MNADPPVKKRSGNFSFRSLSIRQRLPLLICTLLVCTVIALGWLSQLGVKKAALAMGKERLEALTKELSTLFGQSASIIIKITRTAVSQEAFKKYLYAPAQPGNDTSVLRLLDKLRPDSSWVLVELFNANLEPVMHSAPPGKQIRLNSKDALSAVLHAPDSCKVGKFYGVGNDVYYPIMVAVTDKNKVIGYLITWRMQTVTPAVLLQFSQLLGSNATLYLGNRDGSLWTDMIQAVPPPPVHIDYDQHFFEYARPHKDLVIASAGLIPNTPWTLVIEFSQGIMMEASRRFLPWIIGAGMVLVLTGILLAWITSRNITGPLNKLRQAASAMAAGGDTELVEEGRGDELGELAHAFNAMIMRVNTAQQILEQTVEERTTQLYAANKELEAFSYSVSHDLRSPLRAINGYAGILKEDYAAVLDAEGNRITDKIISGAKSMAQLIDDLIIFSKMSKKELKRQTIDMGGLAKSCLEELLQETPGGKYKVQVHPLPECTGDEALVKQVWINLIGNALKYSAKNDAPMVEIGWDENRTLPCYFIRDNGVGFDMKYADKLFGVFQRLHNQSDFEGVGIGLSLVKRILLRHNGAICAESEVGKGAAFYFSIPPPVNSLRKTPAPMDNYHSNF